MPCRQNQRYLCGNKECSMCFNRSFANFSEKEKVECWSLENEKNPWDILQGSSENFIFDCKKCKHTFTKTIASITSKIPSWCPYCAHTYMCDKQDCKHCFDNSFASHEKSIYWSPKNKINPRKVSKSNNKKFIFKCGDCNHEFESSPNNITCNDRWCPYCGTSAPKLCKDRNCNHCFKKSLASYEDKKKLACWDVSKNDGLTPRDINKHSTKNYWFKCSDCHHYFEKMVSNLSRRGCWCPYCSHRKYCGDNCVICNDSSFASHPMSRYLCDDQNIDPKKIPLGGGKRFDFKCFDCGHRFNRKLNEVVAGKWCTYCCVPSKIVCDDNNCDQCYQKSFASHDKSKYWLTEKNGDVKPRDICKSTHTSYWFKCPLCENEFKKRIDYVTRKDTPTFCPICVNKTEKIMYNHLSEYFTTKIQPRFDWCKSPKTGRHYPFDFLLEDFSIIIEIDGMQHFKPVMQWSAPEFTQTKDLYKMKLAIEKGYTIIRILQEDVFYDRTDWKTILANHIKQYETPEIIYLEEGNMYECYDLSVSIEELTEKIMADSNDEEEDATPTTEEEYPLEEEFIEDHFSNIESIDPTYEEIDLVNEPIEKVIKMEVRKKK